MSAKKEKKGGNTRFLQATGYRTELRVLCGWVPQNKQTDDLAWLQELGESKKIECGGLQAGVD